MDGFVILLVLFLGLFVSLYVYKRHIVIDLSETLYGKKDIEQFLSKVNRISVRMILGKKFVLMSQIDAYHMQKDFVQVQKTFNAIKRMKLKPIELFMMLQKEVKICCETNNVEDAKRLLHEMESILHSEKVERGSRLYQAFTDCQYDVSLRLEKSGRYAKELLKRAKEEQNEAASAIYYIKSAQAFHYEHNTDQRLKCLNKAKGLVKNTQFEKDINDVIDGTKDIEELFEGD